MEFEDYALARQYLVEHRIGTRLREAQAVEDEEFQRSRKATLERSR